MRLEELIKSAIIPCNSNAYWRYETLGRIMYSSCPGGVSIGLNGLPHEGAGVCSLCGQPVKEGSTTKHMCDLVEVPDCYVPGICSESSVGLSDLHTTL